MAVKNIINEMTDLELQKKIKEDKKSFRKMKLYHKVSALDNPMQLRTKRREIAKVLTEINKRKRQ